MLPNRRDLIGGSGAWIAGFVLCFVALSASAQPDRTAAKAPGIGLIFDVYRPADDPTPSWILTSLFSQGSLSGTRADWVETGTELLYRAGPAVYLGGRVETREREHDTDVLYSALLYQALNRMLEWNAAVTVTPNPVFSPEQSYAAGFAWRATPNLSLLLDYSRLEFVTGPIDQYKPGVMVWFTERTFLTGRYTFGSAFGNVNFEAYVLRLDLGLSERFRVVLAGAHGSDPEKELGIPRVIVTKADSYYAYGHLTLAAGLELILGAEYEDREDVYTRSTGTVGLSLRF